MLLQHCNDFCWIIQLRYEGALFLPFLENYLELAIIGDRVPISPVFGFGFRNEVGESGPGRGGEAGGVGSGDLGGWGGWGGGGGGVDGFGFGGGRWIHWR